MGALRNRSVKDSKLRTIVAIAVALLIVAEFVSWFSQVLSVTWGFIGALLVAGVTVFCGIQARNKARNTAWFLVPTVLFTVVPLIVKVWRIFTEEKSLLQKVWDHTPFLIGFLLPVGLLIYVYMELRSRDMKEHNTGFSDEKRNSVE